MEGTPKQSIKSLYQALSKPLKVLLTVTLSITGVSLFSIFGFAGWFMFSRSSFDNNPSWKLIILIAFAVLAISAMALAFYSLFVLTKVKIEIDALERKTCQFAISADNISTQVDTAANKLKETLANNRVASFILSSKQIEKLESSVMKDCSIIVLTSKYKLDSGSFVSIILDNIRKGVTYKYLVPDIELMCDEFDSMCSNWWERFWTDIQNSRQHVRGKKRKILQNSYPDASSRYIDILVDVANDVALDRVENKAKDYFCNHVHKYIINKEHTLVTIIMYQMARGTSSSDWEIIMKLSTEMEDNEYYAFKIPKEEEAEKDRLYWRIRNDFCNKDNKRELSIEK